MQELGPEVLLAFIGHSQDAEKEVKAIYALENEFQRELERLNRPGDRVNRFRFWEWNYDAQRKAGGQEGVINPYLKRADIAVFIFKEKIGKVTWEELELCRQRKDDSFYVLPLFPQNPPPGLDLTSLEGTKSWFDLLTKKKDLTKDWTSPSSNSLTPIENYKDEQHLKEIIREQVKKIIPAFLKAQHNKNNQPAEKPPQKTSIPLQIPAAYANWLIDHCRYMDLNKLVFKEKVIQVRLPELFIPLLCDPPGKKALKKEKNLEQQMMEEREKPVEIESLIGQREFLLVEGHAGSGKTTLLKHLALSIIQKESRVGLDHFLPVLVFLKDLAGSASPRMNKAGAEQLLADYFKKADNGLDMGLVKGFCKAGRAIFLLDGLDELPPLERERAAEALADFRLKHPGIKMVLSGRPHGMGAAVARRFGEGHVKIHPLNMDQTRNFVNRWFQYVYDEFSQTGRKNAEQMIGEIRSHPRVSELVDTPLMLTAACVLYHENRKLPDQRAELYEKFVSNLIFKRFEEPLKVMDFFMALAHRIHTKKKKRGFDQVLALEVLEKVYPVKKGGKGPAGSSCERFEEIEQKSGLLKLDGGEYDFRHLTFQEFFAAQYIVTNERDFAKAVEGYWDDPWHEELIELFIGSLSLKNKGWASGLVEDQLKQDGKSRRWRLAGRALLDMPEDVRDPKLVDAAAKRLLEIFSRESTSEALAEAGETLGWLGDPRPLEEFVEVAGGEYDLGEELGKVNVKSFGIGKYPVTNQWFEKFIQAGGYREEYWEKYWTPEGRKWMEDNRLQAPEYWHERELNCPNAPVVGVSWYEADAFCRWLTEERKDGFTYRLPAEQEWQAAAAGKEGREYPWGEWEEGRCNSGECGIGKTSAVGIFEKGNTPEGVADMSGNVWEWTRSGYDSKQLREDFAPDEFGPVLRGGSWLFVAFNCRCAYRYCDHPDYRDRDVGFRCARTLTL